MSYNVLADGYVKWTIEDLLEDGDFGYVKPRTKSFEQLDFQYRSHLIMGEI